MTADKYLTVGGLQRRYLLHTPDNLPQGWCAIIHLHGGEGTGAQSLKIWRDWQDRGVVIAMPYGEAPGKSSHWLAVGNGGVQVRDTTDENFLLALGAELRRLGASRVFMSGFSSGAGMVWQMYGFNAQAFDGFAPNSKGIGTGMLPVHPPMLRPVRFQFGTLDPNFADDGSDGSLNAAKTWNWLKSHAPCKKPSRRIKDVGTLTVAHTVLLDRCAPVLSRVYINGMDHRLPKVEGPFGDPFNGPDAVVEFFRAYAGLITG